MKCEICHKQEARTKLEGRNEDDITYVCEECAARFENPASGDTDEGMFEDEGVEDDGPVQEVLESLDGMLDSIRKSLDGEAEPEKDDGAQSGGRRKVFPADEIPPRLSFCGLLQLEGLFLTGELSEARRILGAEDIRMEGLPYATLPETGHLYRLTYRGRLDHARETVQKVVDMEFSAREALRDELARLYADTTIRALAILKSAKLLSPDELIDLLSPMRIALIDGLVAGITEDAMTRLALQDNRRDYYRMNDDERAIVDADRADGINDIFEDVRLKWKKGMY
ncbi:MAG: hypothetical protein IKP97_05960 [Kiritimatiellae bacterium]|nr:hypothetical protein [Kiritimatiellia bacterium]